MHYTHNIPSSDPKISQCNTKSTVFFISYKTEAWLNPLSATVYPSYGAQEGSLITYTINSLIRNTEYDVKIGAQVQYWPALLTRPESSLIRLHFEAVIHVRTLCQTQVNEHVGLYHQKHHRNSNH